MRRQDLDRATFGIVLAGGGGRGAYQIRCWKKLKELGLDRFSVISGTSVGALNAALIAAGDLPQAVRLWEELEESKVVRTSLLRKWTVAFLCVVLAMLFTAALHITRDQLRRANAKVYVTVSVQDTLVDPYEPNFRYSGPNFDKPNSRPVLLSEPRKIDNFWSPELIELTCLADDTSVREALLQSANLPLVFPSGRWKEHKSVDGAIAMYKGTTQNVPILPAAENRCDYIFVMYLDASADSRLETIRETVKAAFDLRMLRGLSPEDARRIYQAGRANGFRGPPAPPFAIEEDQLICIVPSRPLGSIVDFSGGGRALDLMRLGEEDTERALRARPWFADYIARRRAEP